MYSQELLLCWRFSVILGALCARDSRGQGHTDLLVSIQLQTICCAAARCIRAVSVSECSRKSASGAMCAMVSITARIRRTSSVTNTPKRQRERDENSVQSMSVYNTDDGSARLGSAHKPRDPRDQNLYTLCDTVVQLRSGSTALRYSIVL